MTEEIQKNYENAKNISSDINEHVETLCLYATKAESILELGVSKCVSSWGFVKGLYDNNSTIKTLMSCDIDKSDIVTDVENLCKNVGINYHFYMQNDLTLDIINPVDITFIDTWHVYGQIKRELEKFAPITKKYIIMHDTVVDAVHGESVRIHMDIKKQSEETGFPIEEITRGIIPAIDEFLEMNKGIWQMKDHYMNNNGLMILERVNDYL